MGIGVQIVMYRLRANVVSVWDADCILIFLFVHEKNP